MSISNTARTFNHIIGEINAAFHETALKFGLSDSAMGVLYALSMEEGRCQISDICNISCLPKQTVNSALRKLEREGIIGMESADGKKKIVFLTEKGRILADKTAKRILEIEDEIYARWSDADREKYIDLSRRYLNELKEKTQKL